MKVFIVLAHPEPHSLNASLAKYAVEVLEAAGHEVKVQIAGAPRKCLTSESSRFYWRC